MAAAARAPGPADARTPCPLCGGPIHPIAGRCKHCKGDLSALRAARPAAAAALPALQGPAPAAPRPAPDPYALANGHGNGHAAQAYQAHAEVPLPVQIAHAAAAFAQHEISHPILPPRPTGRMQVAAPPSTWKSWPVIVIILAVIAIVTAVVLMVWPPGGTPERASEQPMPAPERMDTHPLPPAPPAVAPQPPAPPNPNDPWSSRGTAPPDRQPAPDIDDPDLQNPRARDPFSRRGGTLGNPGQFMTAMMFHACERFTQCGHADHMLKTACDFYARQPSVPAPSCPAAQRCLSQIDSMDCDATMNDAAAVSRVLLQFGDCTDALGC